MRPIVVCTLLTLLSLPSSASNVSDLLQAVRPLQDAAFNTHCTVSLINKEKHYWLGAAHCIDANEPQFINGELASVFASVAVDKEGDMAIYFSSTARADRALKLAKKAPKHGDKVFVLGYPAGIGPVLTQGFVGAPLIFFKHYDEYFMALDVAVCGGDSGSAVVNSKDEVVSVLTRYFYPSNTICTAMSGGTPYEVLKAFAGKYFG